MKDILLLAHMILYCICPTLNATTHPYPQQDKSTANGTDDFITKWTDITTDVSFFAVTNGSVNYTWSASPSGNSGSGSFDQSTADVLVTLTGLNVPSGDVLTLCMEPDNLLRFYNAYPPPTIGFLEVNPDRLLLSEVVQWGSVSWTSMKHAFSQCENMTSSAVDMPDLTNVTDMSSMFSNAVSFNAAISGWDVSNVTDMTSLFSLTLLFNQPLSNWDVSNVTDMSFMFALASAFNQPLNGWDVSSVTDMKSMFDCASVFNQPLNGWDVSSVTDMSSMFDGATNFNQPLDQWQTNNVTNMSEMFEDALSFNQPINTWDVSNVNSMQRMFWNTSFGSTMAFNQPLHDWDVSNVTTMGQMFSGSDFNQSIDDWDVSNVTDMFGMFFFASDYNQPLGNLTFNPNVNLSAFLNFSGVDCDSYSTSINGWASNPDTPSNLNLGATGRTYGTNVVQDRNYLINDKGWTITGDNNSGTTCSVTLPVTFTHLNVQEMNSFHVISFSTASEVNNDKFIVEHSRDGKEFRSIATIAGSGNSNITQYYNYKNKLPTEGVNYYRIKQIDYDGNFSYSKMVSADFSSSKSGLSLYPNPTQGLFTITTEAEMRYTVSNISGVELLTGNLHKGVNEVNISSLSSGTYTIRTSDGMHKRVIKID